MQGTAVIAAGRPGVLPRGHGRVGPRLRQGPMLFTSKVHGRLRALIIEALLGLQPLLLLQHLRRLQPLLRLALLRGRGRPNPTAEECTGTT